jgi:hypothetical protein
VLVKSPVRRFSRRHATRTTSPPSRVNDFEIDARSDVHERGETTTPRSLCSSDGSSEGRAHVLTNIAAAWKSVGHPPERSAAEIGAGSDYG